MRENFLKVLKVLLSVSLGLFLVWYIYSGLSEEDKSNIFVAIKKADYSWILLSFFIGILSHVSRAMRWILVLETMNYKPRLSNSFFTVMIGYLANMAFNRAGEVSRCAIMSKYEGIPFNKLFGTVMAERVIDMVILLILTLITFFTQAELIGGFVSNEIMIPLGDKFTQLKSSAIQMSLIVFTSLVLIAIGIYTLRKYSASLFNKIRHLILGFSEGFKTVLSVKKPLQFILHSLFIWLMYFLMLYVCFFTLEETSNVGVMAVLSCMVLGAFAIIAVQGGIGAYPVIISKTLILYGVSESFGFAFGWIAWTGQTVMIILVGLISVILIPGFNKKSKLNESKASYTS